MGVKLRECLLKLVRSLAKPEYVPPGQESPKAGDFIHWAERIADAMASGGTLPKAGIPENNGENDVATGELADS